MYTLAMIPRDLGKFVNKRGEQKMLKRQPWCDLQKLPASQYQSRKSTDSRPSSVLPPPRLFHETQSPHPRQNSQHPIRFALPCSFLFRVLAKGPFKRVAIVHVDGSGNSAIYQHAIESPWPRQLFLHNSFHSVSCSQYPCLWAAPNCSNF